MDVYPRTLSELLTRWQELEGYVLDEGLCHPDILSQSARGAHLGLAIDFPEDSRFYVDFFVQETPGAISPFGLLNTRVSDWNGQAQRHYTAILDLLRRTFPPHTPLATFVRQADSLGMIEGALKRGEKLNPSDLPLVQMFQGGGWLFVKLTHLRAAENEKRRHVIRFETGQ